MKPTGFLRAASPFRPDEYLERAKRAFSRQPAKVIFDHLSPMPSHLLNVSLAGHVPIDMQPFYFRTQLKTYNRQRQQFAEAASSTTSSPSSADSGGPSLPTPPLTFWPHLPTRWPLMPMPLGHHLVYFNPQIPGRDLAPDGADPDHCPGAPFVRRLWAGGSLTFSEEWRGLMPLEGYRAVCIESVEPPRLSVSAGGWGSGSAADKVHVDVVRKYGPVTYHDGFGPEADANAVGRVRKDPAIQEVRRLVFLREAPAGSTWNKPAGPPRKVVKAIHQPDASFTFVPDAHLLFHFSALTFNAHAIHIDPQYAREREGHRGILMHGPLSLVLMLTLLKSKLRHPWRLRNLDYKNLAPLYAGEQVRVCLRLSHGEGDESTQKWNVWVEGPEGGLAVRGTATVVKAVDEASSKRYAKAEESVKTGTTPVPRHLQGEKYPALGKEIALSTEDIAAATEGVAIAVDKIATDVEVTLYNIQNAAIAVRDANENVSETAISIEHSTDRIWASAVAAIREIVADIKATHRNIAAITRAVGSATIAVKKTLVDVEGTAADVREANKAIYRSVRAIAETTSAVEATTTAIKDTTTAINDTTDAIKDTLGDILKTNAALVKTTAAMEETMAAIEETSAQVQKTITPEPEPEVPAPTLLSVLWYFISKGFRR